MYECFDETVAKILLAGNEGDSINHISKKINTPYETVRQKIKMLEKNGYLNSDNFYVTKPGLTELTYQLTITGSQLSPPSIEEAYIIPHFADYEFAYTRIDAAYIWTRGGYQVARSPDDYPLFITVDGHIDYWKNFFDDFDIPVYKERQPREEFEGSIQVVLEDRDKLEIEWMEGDPVIPLEDTVEYMKENYVQFQSGLEILDEMYEQLDLNETYSDRGAVKS